MTLKTRLDCLKLCLLPGIRCGSSLQKQCFSSSVNGGIEQVNQKSPRGHDDDNELGKQTRYISDHSCVRLFGDWSNEHKSSLLENMVVFRDFIAESEEESILAEIGSYLKRMRYEFDHWDDAIHGFRETERLQWRPENERVLRRVRRLALPPGTPPLRHVHVLDLAADGVIKPHVDSRRFCGSVIAGISLLSDAVMRLVSCTEPTRSLNALLPRRSLYIMRNTARYDFTHEVLAGPESQFDGRPVPRHRRISIICRNEPAPDGTDGAGSSAAGDAPFAVTGGGEATKTETTTTGTGTETTTGTEAERGQDR